MSRSDVGELRTYKNWEWKGHSFEVRTEYMRAVGLVDGEVICDLTNTVCEAVVEELYDYGKYLVSNDSSQNGYNCVLCSEVFLDRDEWEKHSHIVHFEEFSEPWTSSILEEKRQDGSVRHFRELSLEDSLDEIEDVMSEWRDYKCIYDDKRGFGASLLGDHLIKSHPEEVFF